MPERGKLIVVSGPSGAGKSTVISKVMENDTNIVFSISATTRAPRAYEHDGVEYLFIDTPSFEKMIEKDELLEYARYVDNYYGSPKKAVLDNLEQGHDVLFDIEVQGAMQIKKKCPEAILIFIIPSKFSEIENRLRGRASDSEEKIQKRITAAKGECRMANNYDYIVINDYADVAAKEVASIIQAEKCRFSERQKYLFEVCSL